MSVYSDAVLADSPNLYLRLAESAGPTAADSSGLGHDGSYTGCTFAQPGLLSGDSDTAVLLDGVDDSLSVTHHADLAIVGDLTIEAWIKPTSLPGTNGRIVAKFDGAAAHWRPYLFNLVSDGSLELQRGNATTDESVVKAAGLTAGNTYHVAATQSGTTVKIYVNGAQVGTDGTISLTPDDNGNAVTIGQAGGGGFLSSVLDEVAVYPSALSAARIAAHYAVGTGAVEQTAIWPYNRQGPF